ncbi:hypothetical protein FA13DRAFT_1795595 [Coprinellus micaceus]|uniref:Uncharacterized protein n=1 Tax=Coprinellus micaceus TaxID=71717 RepID=A0A4Y7SXQ4_COPMI|nr:hypothetical protein FA13DRAFT_1795595 [Coprinellus micaceus]
MTCFLLLANFMMRIWSLGWVRYPNEPMVNWTADTQDQRVNCSTDNTLCMSWSKSFGFAVEGLEKATAFLIQTLVFIVTCLLEAPSLQWLRSTATHSNGSRRGVGFTIPTTVVIPLNAPEITPIIYTVALVVLNVIFAISVVQTRMKVGARLSALVFDAALPSAVVGIALWFIPIYGAGSGAFFYMRTARYTLRMLWASLLVIAPQHLLVKTPRAEGCKDQRSDEETLNEAETNSVDKV